MSNKIGLLLGSLNGAGAEKTILILATELSMMGFSVDLITQSSNADYDVPSGINHIVLNTKETALVCRKLEELTTKVNYNLFITSKGEFYDAIRAERVICSVHITPTAWIRAHKFQLLRIYLKKKELSKKFQNKELVALSKGIKKDLINLGCSEKDIHIIPNSFDIQNIRKLANEKVELPAENYLIYVASFIKRKRHRDLLNAFNLLSDKTLKLVLVGKGNEEESLKKLAKKLGIEERIIFYGWTPNPYFLINNAKISFLASEAEGLPRVLVESLIIGTPVVSTDCPSGPSEVLVNDLKEFLVPVGDIFRIAKATEKALQNYPIEQFNPNRFRAENIAKQYIEYFL